MVREERQAASAVESLGGYQQGLYAERWAPYVQVAGALLPPCNVCESSDARGCIVAVHDRLQGSCEAAMP